jgi:hypothetical protein
MCLERPMQSTNPYFTKVPASDDGLYPCLEQISRKAGSMIVKVRSPMVLMISFFAMLKTPCLLRLASLWWYAFRYSTPGSPLQASRTIFTSSFVGESLTVDLSIMAARRDTFIRSVPFLVSRKVVKSCCWMDCTSGIHDHPLIEDFTRFSSPVKTAHTSDWYSAPYISLDEGSVASRTRLWTSGKGFGIIIYLPGSSNHFRPHTRM